MIGKKIADLIMCPNKQTFGGTIKTLEEQGFSDAVSDYFDKWDKTRFRVKSNGIYIMGEYVKNPAAGNPGKVMVICHGQGATRAYDICYGKIFYDMGFHLVLFDERSFGETGGKYCTLGWKEHKDIKEILKFTRSVFGDEAILGMHGESMGAASALLLLDTEKPDFVIADCPFADLGLLIDELSKKYAGILGPFGAWRARHIGLKRCGFDYRAVRPIDSVIKSQVPICFIHGASDTLIDCKHSNFMYKASKNPLNEIHFVKGAEHAQSRETNPEEYGKICRAFVEKVLNSIK